MFELGTLCRLRPAKPGDKLRGYGRPAWPVTIVAQGPAGPGTYWAEDGNGRRWWWMEEDLVKVGFDPDWKKHTS